MSESNKINNVQTLNIQTGQKVLTLKRVKYVNIQKSADLKILSVKSKPRYFNLKWKYPTKFKREIYFYTKLRATNIIIYFIPYIV